jgi:Hemerythrin HHE cation binding domain
MPVHIGNVAAKAMGKAKVLKGAIEGLSGIFTTLMEEHGQISVLLMRVRASSDPHVWRALFPTIREELLAHEHCELAVLYPVFRTHEATALFALQHEREESELEALIESLTELEVEDPRWHGIFHELALRVHKHVAEEENEFFPVARMAFGQESSALDAAYRAKKQAIIDALNWPSHA